MGEEDNSKVVKSVTMRRPPTKAKGKVIAVGNNNKSAVKNFGVIEDLNEPGSLFDSTPGRMIMRIKSGGGVGGGGDEDDGGGEKKKRLGSKRRKGMLSKRERR